MPKLSVFFVFGNMNKSFSSLVNFINRVPVRFEITVQYGFHDLDRYPIQRANKCFSFLSYDDYQRELRGHDILCGHAGVGFISDCLRFGKMPLVMPRRPSQSEHTNNHQSEFLSKYSNDGIFIKIPSIYCSTNTQISLLMEAAKRKPSRKFITDLAPLADKISDDINFFLKEPIGKKPQRRNF